MIAVGKTLLLTSHHLLWKRASPAASVGGSIRSLIVPYQPVSRKKMYRDSGRKRIRNGKYKKPTLEQASTMPLSVQEMDNSSLVTLGAMGHHKARSEILKRHIMSVERTSYQQAENIFEKIQAKNKEGMFLLALPYQIGIGMALMGAFASLPMVFHLGTAEWFNHHYVTTDMPDPQDLETTLEIGSWTWNWMEPPLGTISFFLLALQFSRAQIQNLGIRPYTAKIKNWRGQNLAEAFPQYDANLLIKYSESSSIYAE